MSINSNGRAADASIADPPDSRDRALNSSPPPVGIRVKTKRVPVRTARTTLAHGRGAFVGWIDLEQCECIDQNKGRDRGYEFDWEALLRAPGGRFYVDIVTIKSDWPNDLVEDYAVEITEREAAGWFADDPESAPDCIQPEKFDLTKAPTDRPEPAAAAPSGNGAAAADGRGIEASGTPSMDRLTATQELLLEALDALTAEQGNRPFASHVIARQARMRNPDLSRYRDQLKILSDKGYCTSSPKGYARTAKLSPSQALARQLSD